MLFMCRVQGLGCKLSCQAHELYPTLANLGYSHQAVAAGTLWCAKMKLPKGHRQTDRWTSSESGSQLRNARKTQTQNPKP